MNDPLSGWAQCGLLVGLLAVFVLLVYLPMIVHWRKMAALFSDEKFLAEHTYPRAELGIGRGYSFHLAVGKRGLRLVAILPLQRLCPPIFIPWRAIYLLQGKPSTLGCDRLMVEVSGLPWALNISFLWRHGNAISVIQRYWEESRATLPEATALQSKSSLIVLNRA